MTGTRYDWLRHPTRMETKDRQEFAALRDSNLKTARAWALKDAAMALFTYVYERPARKHFRWWHSWALRSRPQPIVETAQRLKRRLQNPPSDNECYQRVHQLQDSVGKVHRSRIPQQAELSNCDLLPLRRSGNGSVMPLKSRKSRQ